MGAEVIMVMRVISRTLDGKGGLALRTYENGVEMLPSNVGQSCGVGF